MSLSLPFFGEGLGCDAFCIAALRAWALGTAGAVIARLSLDGLEIVLSLSLSEVSLLLELALEPDPLELDEDRAVDFTGDVFG